ncbi:MAG TPA: RNA polymerase sigma factor [Vicinamibacteria bacterium]|jgi:RNA polymerase sigma-70 factor (ECF subfamily)
MSSSVACLAASFERGGPIPAATPEDRRREEAPVVRRAQDGDMAAFEQLYRDHVGRVFAVCLRLCGDAALAEELAQEAFVRAWQKLGSFRGESAFSSWLYTLAVNTTLTERRSRRRRTSRVVATDDLAAFDRPGRPPGPEHGFDLEKALANLPPGARAVLVLHDVEGYKHHEIAEMTGIAEGTSKAQLHRARRLLREALTP